MGRDFVRRLAGVCVIAAVAGAAATVGSAAAAAPPDACTVLTTADITAVFPNAGAIEGPTSDRGTAGVTRCSWDETLQNNPAISVATQVEAGESSIPAFYDEPGAKKLTKKQLKSAGLTGKGDSGLLIIESDGTGGHIILVDKKAKTLVWVDAGWSWSGDALPPALTEQTFLALGKAATAKL